jgi:hypothetical protein
VNHPKLTGFIRIRYSQEKEDGDEPDDDYYMAFYGWFTRYFKPLVAIMWGSRVDRALTVSSPEASRPWC